MSSTRYAVLLEEYNLFRQALACLLLRDPDIEMVAEASTAKEGRDIVLKDPAHVDVVVAELLLYEEDGMQFLRALREADVQVPVLVLTALRDRDAHDLALQMGAAEVMTKEVPIERIVASIKKLGA